MLSHVNHNNNIMVTEHVHISSVQSVHKSVAPPPMIPAPLSLGMASVVCFGQNMCV